MLFCNDATSFFTLRILTDIMQCIPFMRSNVNILFLKWCTATALSLAVMSQAATRPNILLIMSDDMGYSDIGCYGSEIHTPNLDRLAANGLRFTQFYNGARCCPTRASLLTGLYAHQTGVGHMLGDRGLPGYQNGLNQHCVTIAEALSTSGYRTYMSGKWHVTTHTRPEGPKDNWPLQRGFEKFYGTIIGAGSFFDPHTLCRQNTFITPDNDPEYQPETFYYTDAITDNAIRFIDEHNSKAGKEPFFMYVSYTAAHWPMQALPEDIRKYEGDYDNGYDYIRLRRHERMKQMGLIPPDTRLSPAAGDWSKLPNKEWEIKCMEVYAAMVDRMDQGIGRIIESLEANQTLDNTLILFLQDNGGCAEGFGRGENINERWVSAIEDRSPMGINELQPTLWPPMKTRDGRPVQGGPGIMPGPEDTYIAYGRNWANVSNTPFKEYKHWVHEGGISTPLIVHWPERIKSSGELRHQPGHLIDVMATCMDVSGTSYPSTFRKEPIHPMEGRSLQPAFDNRPIEREAIYWEHEANCAVRADDWKLVRKGSMRDGELQDWELYHLKQDRSEMNNLAAQNPGKVKELEAKWDVWAHRAFVKPWPWKPATSDN